jgi:hypothetical protein
MGVPRVKSPRCVFLSKVLISRPNTTYRSTIVLYHVNYCTRSVVFGRLIITVPFTAGKFAAVPTDYTARAVVLGPAIKKYSV